MDDVALSKTLSHALRHEPWLYELELDDEGWTSVESMLEILRAEKPEWANLTVSDLERVTSHSTKRRHEIVGERIRALYGHSLPGKLAKAVATPPDILYHGTNAAAVSAIQTSGLLPMSRQYVHLSVDTRMAMLVGQRKGKGLVLLTVKAREAHDSGLKFYIGNESVWLADRVLPEFLEVVPSME